jgi:hypothetical protein
MRYMLMFTTDTDEVPACKTLPAMGVLAEELVRHGVLLSTEGLYPSARGARVRLTAKEFSVVDGPFAEAKELVAGYVIVQVNSKEQAVQLARRFLQVAGSGSCEIREVIDS